MSGDSTAPAQADALRAALQGLRTLKAQVASLQAARHAPVAVIGMSCRFPGADDPDAFWRLLNAGVDAVGPIPPDRFDVGRWLGPAQEPGRLVTPRAGTLSDVARFDADRFGVSHREARSMDPQQRLLLEAALHALEDAGRLGLVEGSDAGVYLGVALTDWDRRTLYQPDLTQQDVYAGTGVFNSVAAGRLSYTLGLRGPAVSLDTACSSSLVAVHLAMQALRAGECGLALAGGVNLLLAPDASVYFSAMGALSPDGRCKAFDADADGYVRAEGVGVVVLKRLDDALRDGDRVLAVLRGSAVNQDGRSNGLTAPNPDAQKALLRQALADAGATAADVGAVEAHGTGTPLGDPIEVEALREVYGAGDGALPLGAVKTVIGHAEAAAGVAGLIKAIQVVRHGVMPANQHFTRLNPRCRVQGSRLMVPTAPVPVHGLVGVSGFGMSGTNAHVLVGPAPAAAALPASDAPYLLALSAPDPARLAALVDAARARLAEGVDLGDAALTAGDGRQHLAHRVAVVAASAAEAADALAVATPSVAGRAPRVGVVLGPLAAPALAGWPCDPAAAALRDAIGETGAAWWLAARLVEAGVQPAVVVGHGAAEADAEALAGARARPWEPASQAPQTWLGLGSAGGLVGGGGWAAVADKADLWIVVGDARAPDGGAALVVSDRASALRALGELYLRGNALRWSALAPGRQRVAWPLSRLEGPRLWLDDPMEAARGGGAGVLWREELRPVSLPPGAAPRLLDLRGAHDPVAAARTVLDGSADGAPALLVTDDPWADPVAGALWGLGRVLAQERPGGLLGVLAAPGADAALLASVSARADGRDLVVRDGVLHEVVLTPTTSPSPGAPARDGAWWIAGGLGALGLQVAGWLVERGVTHVVLTGRRPPRDEAPLAALRARGARVDVVLGDLSDAAAAVAARARIDAPVVGVVHAAGLLDDAPASEVTDDQLAAHWRAKVDVARHLVMAVSDDPVDAVVVIGSATVSLGIPGQAAYAAANGALRALPGLRLVELGPVQAGMADEATRARLAVLGIGALGVEEALGVIMGAPAGSVGLRVDGPTYARAAAGRRVGPLFGLAAVAAPATAADPADVVHAEVARVLGRDDLAGLDLGRGLFELGLDSMTAVALARGLEHGLGVPVPATIAFDQPDVAALVAWARAAVGPAPQAQAASGRAMRADEPVAIIGMACRFPGGVDSPAALWALLQADEDAVRPIPAERWDADGLYDPTPGTAGRSYVRDMALLDDVAGFDAAWFGISPKEAASLDPQQRLLLMVGVEALEHAGVPLASVVRSRTGVFVGIGPSDYGRRFDALAGPVDPYAGTGNEPSFAAGRLAYVLGAQGPAVGMNTACSTSLVALHQAVAALRAGECALALAGGVHLILAPDTTVQLSQLQALSPGGRCRTFDADADGYGRGEGVGVVVLKRLSDARRDGDRVLAVVLGSAVNHDGPSAGLTVPSGSAQQALMRAALDVAGLSPADVTLLEAHGTGTRLGDPIELGAVKAVYGDRPADHPLVVTAVKTHLNHAELAAGAAGVLATVLALRHALAPPLLHLSRLNPDLDLDFPVRLAQRPTPLVSDVPLRGAVSSFGLSGTNAHVVIEQGDPDAVGEPPARSHQVLVWSARSEQAAAAMAARLAAAVDGLTPAQVADLAFSLHRGRSQHRYRAWAVGADAASLAAALRAGPPVVPARERPVVWMFTGQGSQWPGMVAGLLALPAFAAVWARADEVLFGLRGRRLSDVVDTEEVHDTAWTQPALVALQLGLAAALRAWGQTPDAVIGHSVGEIAAACVAGVMDEATALRMAATRGALMSALPRDGGMAQVAAREDVLRERLTPGLDVAAVNAGDETVISGDTAELDALVARLEAEGARVRRLVVSHAFHSPKMDGMLDAFEASLRELDLRAPTIPVLSNLTARAESAALTTPGYWREHVRRAVRFADGLRAAPADALFVELGPHPVLASFATRARPEAVVVPTLRRGRPALEGVADAVGALAAHGASVDLLAWDAPWQRAVREVPVTPWRLERHWIEAAPRAAGAVPGAQRLLVTRWLPAADIAVGRRWRVVGEGAPAVADALRALGDAATVGELADAAPGEDVLWLTPRHGDEHRADAVVAGLGALRAARAAGARLTAVTWGVSEGAGLGGAGLWGLLRTAALELPDATGGIVDVVHEAADPAAIARAARADRPVRRTSPDGVQAPVLTPTAGQQDLTVRGVWWVTGGTGAVGRQLARRLLDAGADRVVLTARRPPAGAAAADVAAMSGVTVLTGDVAVAEDVVRLTAQVQALGPLRGVVHAAGALADGALARLEAGDVEAVWASKVEGAHHLHAATADVPLDAFVLVASAAGGLGWQGQANYAAANAWLDAFALHRRGLGLPALSIGFGPWDGEGMATPGVRDAMARVGMRPLRPAEALGALHRALAADLGVCLAVDLDLAAWARRHPWGSALLGEAPTPAATPLPAAPPADRKALDALVREVTASVLGLPDPAALDATRGLFELGLDSLMAVQLARQLGQRAMVDLPDTVAFDRPSVAALVEHLAQGLTPVVAAARGGARDDEPVAIIGLACRLPGGVDGPEAFWALLDEGRDAVGPVPLDRWDNEAFYDPTPGLPGRTCAREGGFVDDVAGFESAVFGVSPKEALRMDPQQRLLLEATWHALEHAGVAPDGLTGARAAIYVGAGGHDYERVIERAAASRGPDEADDGDGYVGTGNDLAFAAGRLAWHLGTHGPTLTLDTACSSGLVAIHHAARALRDGEADVGIAGGVRLMLSPESTLRLSALKALSPRSRCRTFDATADGYARGEGVAVVVLKRLSDARRDGDRVLAVLAASGVNHDGPSSGLTVPSGAAQAALLGSVLADAGLRPEQVDAIEAHGTGTSLGDPIEVAAVGAVYGDRPAARPLWLTAVKSQIGHTELAAGAVGVVKAVLALQHDRLPPVLHLTTLNPAIDRRLPVAVATRPVPLPRDHRRVVGVSAFGLAGTNAHALVADPPDAAPPPEPSTTGAHLLLLTSASEAGLEASTTALAGWLDAHPDADLGDVARTLVVGRARLRHRRALVARDAAEAAELLRRRAGLVDGVLRRGAAAPTVCWLFTGQGSQRVDMGRRLYEAFPVVRDVIDRCDAELRAVRGEGLLPVLFPRQAGSPIDQTAWTQPALYAVEVAVAALWASLGLRPDVVMGHSVGEIAAAHVAGVMSLEDGLRLVEARGRLMQLLPQDGAMGAIMAPEATVRRLLDRYDGHVDVAAVNGPEETVVSGDADGVRELLQHFAMQEVQTRELVVSHAFHSRKMEPMLGELEGVVRGLRLSPPTLPVISNVTATRVEHELTEPAYWSRHVRQAVRFAPGVEAAWGLGARWFVEVGPHPVLAGLAARTLAGRGGRFVASMRRGQDDLATLLHGVSEVVTAGVELDLRGLDPRSRPGRADLPRTPFQRERLWVEGGAATAAAAAPSPVWRRAREAVVPGAPRARRVWVVGGLDTPALTALGASGASVDASLPWGEGLEEALGAAALRGPAPDEVVLWAPGGDGDAAAVGAAVGVLLDVHRWAPRELARPVPVTVVADDGVVGEALRAAQRTAALEAPRAHGRLVTLGVGWSEGGLAAALAAPGEDELVVDGQGVAALRLTSLVPPPGRAWPTVVLTGGLGAVGQRLAHAVVAQGARRLVLNGRRAPSPEVALVVEAWRAQGVRVEVIAGDVARVAPALAAAAEDGPALVVHAAGALDDAPLAALDGARVAALARAKLDGAVALLDAFPTATVVLVSSAAAWMGAPGQAAYAAANGAMDALASARHRPERPVTSLAFGPWAGAGMAEAHVADMARRGISALPPASACAALLRAAGVGGVLGALAADWGLFRPVFEASGPRSLLKGLGAPAPEAAAVARTAARGPDALLRVVAEAAAAALGVTDPSRLDVEQGFFDMGMDSLMSVALAERLTRALGRDVPPSMVLDFPTARRLAGALAAEGPDEPAPSAAVPAAEDDPVAIVGMACRFPGAPDVDAFWDLLVHGRSAVGEAPRARWPEIDALLHPEPGTPGRVITTRGAFLDTIEDFDPLFFGVSPREAAAMDPQQRLLLEVCWEALQDAGVRTDSLREVEGGVFVGMGASEYDGRFQEPPTPTADPYSGPGNDTSFAAGRIAWMLGLRGPALTVNTACSASLVALHLAAQALRTGECEVALAGGVNLMVLSDSSVRLSQLRALSPTARCAFYDASADGYVRGEGAGVVVLERLSVARARGHRVLAIVRGSAVNHDGPSSALTVPSGPAQTALLRRAWRAAGVGGDDLGYVEAHGTGTRLGDPIEARALAAALGPRTSPLPIGSVKSNVGHLELAAGAAGLIKAVLALRHRVIPPSLHFRERNPEIPEALPLRVPTVAEAWTGPAVAGVSSFGLSGTNAHVVIAAGDVEAPAAPAGARPLHALALAAHSSTALDTLAAAVGARLAEADAADVARTATLSRSRGEHRLVALGADAEALRRGLVGGSREGVVRGVASPMPPRVAFVYGGTGGVYPAMGALLAAGDPAVAADLAEVEALAAPLLGRPLAEAVCEPAALEDEVTAHLGVLGLQVALTRALERLGLAPAVVAGHGAGEIAAAWAAGVWTLPEAVGLAHARGAALTASPEGALTAFVAPRGVVEAALVEGAFVAVVNGEASTVVGGRPDAVAEVTRRLAAQDVVAFALPQRRAVHTPMVPSTPWPGVGLGRAPALPWRTAAGDVTSPAWWAARASVALDFQAVCGALREDDPGVVLELSPTPALLGFLRRGLGGRGRVVLGTCRAEREWETLLEAVGSAWCAGASVDLTALAAPSGGRVIALPFSPYERRRCWVERPRRGAATPPPAPTAAPARREDPEAFLRAEAERLLGLGPGQLDPRRPLAWQGFDSIMATDLKRAVDAAFGVDLPHDAVVSGPAVAELVGVLASLPRR